jgi:hypothetical protein
MSFIRKLYLLLKMECDFIGRPLRRLPSDIAIHQGHLRQLS